MAYIVDTNVVSELTKKQPNLHVIEWLEEHSSELFLTVVTVEEMRFGCLMMPAGKRRDKLAETIDALVESYASRIFDFETHVAEECARLHAQAIEAGRTPTIEDLMIAALCVCHDAVLVTRNVRDFDYLGIEVVNPFEE